MNSGYKQTEVGVIPEEWEVAKVGEISRVIRGASPRPKGDRRYYGGPVPRLMVEDVTRDGKTVFPQVDSLTEEGAKLSRPCKKGTLTIVCSGTVGIPSFLGVDACIHDGFLALVSIRKAVSSDYLYYQFDRLRLSFESSATHGGVFTNLTTAGVREFIVPLPPTETEQRAIATALSDVDGLLGGLDRLIAKKRDLKQAAMQQLLTGQTRLPGFHGEWETVAAGDIGVFKGGSGFPLTAQGETGGDYPFFKVSDMNSEGNETFLTAANHYISEHTRKRLGATAFPAGSIVFAKVGAAVFLERKKILRQASCIDNNMAAFVLDKSRADVGYVHSLLLSKKLGALVATTALPALNAKQLGEMPLAVPPLPEQRAIAAVLSDMDAELAVLEARRAKTRSIKHGMMQELLTGMTRLV